MGWQTEIHRDHRGFVPTDLRDGGFPILGHDGFVAVERPAHLLLQGGIVLHDQQGRLRFAHETTCRSSEGSAALSADGSTTRTLVPVFGALSIRICPP